jgi:hypothetical protein
MTALHCRVVMAIGIRLKKAADETVLNNKVNMFRYIPTYK